MEFRSWAQGVDVTKPSAARMHDYWLGGSHNFAIDRDVARKVIAAFPSTPVITQENRAFLRRAVRYLVGQGVRQFLDIGSGLPTVGNVHTTAQRAAPESRVAYVDIDPVAVTHGRHLLASNDRATVILADLRRPATILDHADLRQTLDLDQPVGLMLISVLHFVPDTGAPHDAVAQLGAALSPGSYLTVSHAAADTPGRGAAATIQDIYQNTGTPAVLRTRADIERFFAGFDLVDPGLVWLTRWRPEEPDEDADPDQARHSGFLAGIGRKPG